MVDRNIGIDFETYYDQQYTLRNGKLATSMYIRDPRFKTHCFGFRMYDEEFPRVTYGFEETKKFLKKHNWKKTSITAHHAQFDGLILSHHYDVQPCYYFDTLSMARALYSSTIDNDLDSLAEYLGLGNKLPDVLPMLKGVRDPHPLLLSLLGDYCRQDVAIMMKALDIMSDGFPKDEFDLIDTTVAMFTKPVLRIDRKLAAKAAREEREEEKNKVERTGLDAKTLGSSDKFAQELEKHGVHPPRKISPSTGKPTWAFSKQDLEFMALKAHPDENVRNLIEARLSVKSTIGATRAEALLARSESGNRFPVYLNYGRAHTLRWTGGDKVNPQNFVRDSDLRRSIMAPTGEVLCVLDSSQIEARFTAALAGQEDLVEKFRQGVDEYSEFASDFYGRKITKETAPTERFVGKTCILGLGFGMGGPRLQFTLAVGMMGPPVYIELSDAYKAVDLYRNKYPMIPRLWKFMESMLPVLAGTVPGPVEYGPFTFEKGHVHLPNGLSLLYPDLRFRGGEWTYASSKGRSKIYGGLLTENIVQCGARIVVGEQLLKIQRKEKVRAAMMTHDEGVFPVVRHRARPFMKSAYAIMRTPPAWMPDLPVDCEGGYAVRYSK